MTINLFPIAIWIAEYRRRNLEKTMDKWLQRYLKSNRQSECDILVPGILHCSVRMVEIQAQLIEMKADNSRWNGKIISFTQ